MMTIQYLDSNAYDLTKSLESLFSGVGFNPKILLDTRVAVGNGTIKIESDDSDTQMLTQITNSINNVTQGRIKCAVADSKGHGQTRIFIGQKGLD
jgi:hypothetical protein